MSELDNLQRLRVLAAVDGEVTLTADSIRAVLRALSVAEAQMDQAKEYREATAGINRKSEKTQLGMLALQLAVCVSWLVLT